MTAALADSLALAVVAAPVPVRYFVRRVRVKGHRFTEDRSAWGVFATRRKGVDLLLGSFNERADANKYRDVLRHA